MTKKIKQTLDFFIEHITSYTGKDIERNNYNSCFYSVLYSKNITNLIAKLNLLLL